MSQPYLEKRVQNPEKEPTGLAFVAHGRLGGNFDCPVTSALAEHLCSRGMRVITWNARGIGQSEGRDEWSDARAWMGDDNCSDYKTIFREGVLQFMEDYPHLNKASLFVCGYSAGAIYATTIRIPAGLLDKRPSAFQPIQYILLSYPVWAAPVLGLVAKTGWYFRALEGIVGGGGWEACNSERPADVLILTGGAEIPWFSPTCWAYQAWINTVKSKHRNEQGLLWEVVVKGADHVWGGHLHRIGEEVDKWLAAVNERRK